MADMISQFLAICRSVDISMYNGQKIKMTKLKKK